MSDAKTASNGLALTPRDDHFDLIKYIDNGQTEVLSLSLEDIIALQRLVHNRLSEVLSRIQPNPLGISPIAALPMTRAVVGPNSLNSEVVLGLQDTLDVTMRYRMAKVDALDLSSRLRQCAEKVASPPKVHN